MGRRRTPIRQPQGLLAGALLVVALLVAACGGGEPAGAEDGRWRTEGPLLAWEGTLWVVGGVPLVVPSELGMDERRWLGAIVTATGTLDEQGRRVADEVSVVEGELPNSSLPAATVSGAIDTVAGDAWQVGDRAVYVPPGVTVEGNGEAAPGTLATVEGYVLDDGRVLATHIVLRAASEESDAPPGTTPDPAETPDGGAPDDGGGKQQPDKPDRPDKPDKDKHDDDDEGSLRDGMYAG